MLPRNKILEANFQVACLTLSPFRVGRGEEQNGIKIVRHGEESASSLKFEEVRCIPTVQPIFTKLDDGCIFEASVTQKLEVCFGGEEMRS